MVASKLWDLDRMKYCGGRALWSKEGDKNTGVFHHMANARKGHNYIGKIRRSNGFTSVPKEVK